MTRVVNGVLYRTEGAKLLASRPFLRQYENTARRSSGYRRSWTYTQDKAYFLFRDDRGRYFAQTRFRSYGKETDDLVPLGLSAAINLYDNLEDKHIALAEAFPLAKFSASELDEAVHARDERTKGQYEYDIALTFAGTEREHAETLATLLRDRGYVVFYDRWNTPELWGTELPISLDEVYRLKSRYCVMFISKEYAQRPWTHLERRSAIARAIEERGNTYILPIRVDDTELPGIAPTVSYVRLTEYSVDQLANFIAKKLGA